MTPPPTFSREFLAWAHRAGYSLTPVDHSNAAILWSDPGGETRYYARLRDDGWIELTRASRGGDEQFTLMAASTEVLERYLLGLLGDVIRDQQGLPVLRAPWGIDDLADGYTLSNLSEDGYRTLAGADSMPLARSRDKTMSLLDLVPLSHYLQMSVSDLKESYLSASGAPLLLGDGYRSRHEQ
jgi:hypothetical protein